MQGFTRIPDTKFLVVTAVATKSASKAEEVVGQIYERIPVRLINRIACSAQDRRVMLQVRESDYSTSYRSVFILESIEEIDHQLREMGLIK